jgi:hypothetical protein
VRQRLLNPLKQAVFGHRVGLGRAEASNFVVKFVGIRELSGTANNCIVMFISLKTCML